MVETNLSKEAFKSFRKLRDASETARYLSFHRMHPGVKPSWIDKPAPAYFGPEDAINLVEKVLSKFKFELDFKI